MARISDLYGLIASITGKVELVYEGELEGISNVATMLISKSIRTLFIQYFPDPEKMMNTILYYEDELRLLIFLYLAAGDDQKRHSKISFCQS